MDAQQLDLFEKYRAGELNQTEMREFEERLRKEGNFADSYQQFVLAAEGAEYLAYKDLKNKLRQANTENSAKSPRSRITRWAIAASILILTGLLLFKGWQYGSPQLIDRYVLEPRFSNNRSNDIDDWTEVKQMLDQGDYEMVLDDLSTNSPNDPFSSLVRGYALLKSDQADEAIRVFSELSETTSNYQQQAQFQLALALLQAGETTDAISTLDEIAGHPDHDYSPAAINLLDDLNSYWRWISFSD